MINVEINNKELISAFGKLIRSSSNSDVANFSKQIAQKFDLQINRIEDLVKEFKGNMPPNRIEHYIVAIITSGSGIKKIGLTKFDIEKNLLMIFPSNVIHSSENWSKSTKGFMLTFDPKIFASLGISGSFINLHELFNHSTLPYRKIVEDESQLITLLFEQLFLFTDKNNSLINQKLLVLKLAELLLHFKYHFNTATQNNTQVNPLVEKFVTEVENNFKTEKQVGYYANRLLVHPNHLNYCIKKVLGITAKEFVAKGILLESEYYLKSTSIQLKEIAYLLGFTEYTHFSKFFSSKKKISPKQYRTSDI